GCRASFRGELFLSRRSVDFLEITADHFFESSPGTDGHLELLAAHFTLVPHGLNLSLGSADGIDPGYLGRLAALVRWLDPPWWSEHIAFTRAGGIEIGHLSPLPFTREAVDVLCRNIDVVRRRIDTPLILENITYALTLPDAEMDEAEFLADALERTGCGL